MSSKTYEEGDGKMNNKVTELHCPHCGTDDEDYLEFLNYERQDQASDEYGIYHIMVYHCNNCDNDFQVEEQWDITYRTISKKIL